MSKKLKNTKSKRHKWIALAEGKALARSELPNKLKPKLLPPHKADTSRTRARIARWRAAFIDALSRVPSVTAACKASGISRTQAYACRDRDEDFAAAWDDAIAQSIDALEAFAYARAIRGSEQLTIFFLKAYKPERFKDSLQVDTRLCGVLVVPEKEQLPP